MAASTKITVFLKIAQYGFVELDRRFRHAYFLHYQGDDLIRSSSSMLISFVEHNEISVLPSVYGKLFITKFNLSAK
jgi:hypothetical protein